MITNIPCVILAGGKSGRMGEDKSLLPFGEFDTLIEYQHNKLSQIFSNVYISSKIDKFNFPCNIIYDNDSDCSSPMIALESILEQTKDDNVFIITVDTPLVKKETIHKIINSSKNHEITIAKSEGNTHNLCGVFSIKLLHNIKQYIEKNIHQINYLIKNSNTVYIRFDDDIQFININTKDEYKTAKRVISSTNNTY